MVSHMPVNDMIAETSATKNNLSRDSLIWPSAWASYNNRNRNRNETERNWNTIARAAVTQLHQDHESYLGLVSPTLQTRSVKLLVMQDHSS